MHAKGSPVINDQTGESIRALFDWRKASIDGGRAQRGSSPGPVATDELALALQLLACNPRDREQFLGARADAAPAA